MLLLYNANKMAFPCFSAPRKRFKDGSASSEGTKLAFQELSTSKCSLEINNREYPLRPCVSISKDSSFPSIPHSVDSLHGLHYTDVIVQRFTYTKGGIF